MTNLRDNIAPFSRRLIVGTLAALSAAAWSDVRAEQPVRRDIETRNRSGAIVVAEAAAAQRATVSIYVNRQQNQRDEKVSPTGIVLYEQESAAEFLRLLPKAFPASNKFDLMRAWKGNAPIEKGTASELAFGPANIIVDIKNNGKSALQIVDGYLDVADSMTDLHPFLELNSNFDAGCANEDTTFDPVFAFVNSGWGPVENAEVSYNFYPLARGTGEQLVTSNIGTFNDDKQISVLEGLKKLGVDVDRLQRGDFPCESRAALAKCLQRLVAAGTFGKLPAGSFRRASRDKDGSSVIVADVSGFIQYTWKDTKGSVHQQRSPFTIEIPLFAFKVGVMAECGAGGPEDPDHPTIRLRLDAQNYRLPIQYRATLRAGQNTRLALSLTAEKASQHAFRIALRLSDNTIVDSGPIQLQYMKLREPVIPDDPPDDPPK